MGESIQGKTALITGAAKRIGRVTALALAAEGVNVIVHYDHSAADAVELSRELTNAGVRSWTLQADFSTPKGYETLIARALQEAEHVDILINNASIFPQDTLESLDFTEVTENLRVNAWAPFTLCRAFADQVGQGKIVNMLDSRICGYDWAHVGYVLSKHMLHVLTRMMALEFAPSITVNSVAPGLILPPPGKDMRYLERLTETVPLKRHGTPQDIADAIVYLVKSAFLTGEVIFVDGGRHLWEYVGGPHPH